MIWAQALTTAQHRVEDKKEEKKKFLAKRPAIGSLTSPLVKHQTPRKQLPGMGRPGSFKTLFRHAVRR